MRVNLRLRAAVPAVAVLAMLVFGAGLADAKARGKQQPLKLVAEEIQSEFLDNGAPGPSLGDELVFSETLFRRGREVGTSGVVCTVTQAVAPYEVLTFHCVATLSLERGQITLQGLIEVQGEDDPGPFVVAVTGGTGDYRGAGGKAVVRDVGTTSVYKLWFTAANKQRSDKRAKKH